MKLPKDPVILLSYINTQLRDFFPSLEELCKSSGVAQEEVCSRLAAIDYRYNKETNRFQ